MANNQLTEPDYPLYCDEYPPLITFDEFKFHADDDINELLTSLKTDVFDANEFKESLLVLKDLIECMGWAHEDSMDNMQTTIDNIIVQSNNKLMEVLLPSRKLRRQ
jgi:hypothetical protein